MGIFEELKEQKYRLESTPKDLKKLIIAGKKSGKYIQHGYVIPFKVKREDETTWVVSTEKISRKGYSSGGIFYISKLNPSKCIWD